jgi:hypothetical protein
VDDDGLDGAVVHRSAEGGEVGFAVGGRAPHARGLVEDLDRFAAEFGAALHRLGQAARL